MSSLLSNIKVKLFTNRFLHNLYQNMLAALVVSFVAISLGASFGVMSGRGALSGMLAAGIIACITSLLGGTRIQCSGPTAPMSAVSVAVFFAATQLSADKLAGMTVDQVFNFTVILSSLILLIAAILRTGNLIRLIPHSVISGFMSGIAMLIWIAQVKQLFLLDGTWTFGKTQALNTGVAILTLAIIFGLPRIPQRHIQRVVWAMMPFFPMTLFAIIFCTLLVNWLSLPIATIDIDASLFSGSLLEWVGTQVPSEFSWSLLWFSLPLAFELSLLCYLDTLMTALVMDKMSREKTQRNRELAAQGVANAIAVMFGGLPGAQATIRSVLILKEGATSRLAGVLVGVFVIVELFVFLDWISMIPQAVFVGILFKVGYDVFDWTIVKALYKKATKQQTAFSFFDLPLIVLTVLVTIFYNLSAAAIGATVLFYLIQKFSNNALPDLHGIVED
ncbi:MAG: hypothetical protein CSA42_06945 [Gammaproteobacteria bacterium]|nr:MAG: hypothetical protein CSA42_06945 [Gammaproteobacteria bacterium]